MVNSNITGETNRLSRFNKDNLKYIALIGSKVLWKLFSFIALINIIIMDYLQENHVLQASNKGDDINILTYLVVVPLFVMASFMLNRLLDEEITDIRARKEKNWIKAAIKKRKRIYTVYDNNAI